VKLVCLFFCCTELFVKNIVKLYKTFFVVSMNHLCTVMHYCLLTVFNAEALLNECLLIFAIFDDLEACLF